MSWVDDLVRRHGSIFLDTNLLIFPVIGRVDRDLIKTFKRTSAYDIDDLDRLMALLAPARSVYVTPNIVTETDNLVRQLPDRYHARVAASLNDVLCDWVEVFRPSHEYVGQAEHVRLGLTDAILLQAASASLIITDDFRLAGTIQANGGNVVNFNHVRHLQ